jgi:hypothetical protein
MHRPNAFSVRIIENWKKRKIEISALFVLLLCQYIAMPMIAQTDGIALFPIFRGGFPFTNWLAHTYTRVELVSLIICITQAILFTLMIHPKRPKNKTGKI